jgi:hypothetical protein
MVNLSLPEIALKSNSNNLKAMGWLFGLFQRGKGGTKETPDPDSRKSNGGTMGLIPAVSSKIEFIFGELL